MNDAKKGERIALINLKSDELLGFKQAAEVSGLEGPKSQIEMSRLFSKRGGSETP